MPHWEISTILVSRFQGVEHCQREESFYKHCILAETLEVIVLNLPNAVDCQSSCIYGDPANPNCPFARRADLTEEHSSNHFLNQVRFFANSFKLSDLKKPQDLSAGKVYMVCAPARHSLTCLHGSSGYFCVKPPFLN